MQATPPPRTPVKHLGFLLYDTARLLRRRMDQNAQALGMTSAQWRVLSFVARAELTGQEPPNQATLADFLEIEPITLSRQVDRIEAAGLIERRPDPNDRRAHRLFLTDSARPLVESFRAAAAEVMGEALEGIPEADVERMIAILSTIRSNITGRPDSTLPAVPAEAPRHPVPEVGVSVPESSVA